MSFQAINDVTKALSTLIESQVKLAIPTAKVSLLPPGDTLPEETGVNLYLYRIHESPFTRNEPWRGDRERAPLDKPPLGLQLHYLLTPLGKTSEANASAGDVAHTLLGIAMLTLHEHPILNDTHIPGFDADVVLSDHLRNSFEDVKVTLSSVSVEDLSKIWATINKPYRLSVAYEASVIELVSDRKPPLNGGIVLTTNVEVFTLDPPRIEALTPASGAVARLVGNVVTANDLVITGSALGRPGQQPIVRVGGTVIPLSAPATPPFTSLTVPLPDDLDAGPQVDVRVTLAGKTSQPATFTVVPWLASIGPIRTDLPVATPTIKLTGDGLTATPQVRYEGPAGINTTTASIVSGVLEAPIPTSLTNGIYDVRVQLPGNELSNGRTLEVIPLVNTGPTVTVVGGKHRINITGARLNGTQITLIVDGIPYQAPANAGATSLTFTFQRLLTTGQHTVAVDVDGSRSHTVPFTVT
jgi:hypothetical protein